MIYIKNKKNISYTINMVFDSIMKEIKNFCNDDDSCIIIILILIGFLLCMFFNKEGFFAGGEELNEDIGKKPTPTIQNKIVNQRNRIGMYPSRNDPMNGFGSLDESVKVLRSNPLNPLGGIENEISLKQIDYSFPMGVLNNRSGGFYPYNPSKNPELLSDWGPDKPLKQNVKSFMKSTETVLDTDNNSALPDGVSKEIELVLFFAPWCGHSKNMLNDYDDVIREYHDKTEDEILYKVIKIDMEQNPEAAKEYNVEVKGFPTLYTFYTLGDKKISKEFHFRKKDEIIKELTTRGKQIKR